MTRNYVKILHELLKGLFIFVLTVAEPSFEFVPQPLGSPFYGQHVGVAHADLNSDGLEDLLFAAGRHWIDQSFALINLGPSYDENGGIRVKFSPPIPIGDPGGYYQVDTSRISSLKPSELAVLLVGGTCEVEHSNRFGRCEFGNNTPAVLLSVSVTGCSYSTPNVPCQSSYTEIWRDPKPLGDRNGAFAPDLGNGVDPAIVLVGQGGVEIYVPNDQGKYDTKGPTFHQVVAPRDGKRNPRSDKPRYAAIGMIRLGLQELPGLVAGRRTDYDGPPNPSLVVVRDNGVDSDGGRRAFRVLPPADVIGFGGEPYGGNASFALQPTGYAIGDLDGDGIDDIAEATFLYPDQIVAGHPLPQRILFLNESGMIRDSITLDYVAKAGRSVAIGKIFSDGYFPTNASTSLPDIAFATTDGSVIVFANLGKGDVHEGKGGTKTTSPIFERRAILGWAIRARFGGSNLSLSFLAPCPSFVQLLAGGEGLPLKTMHSTGVVIGTCYRRCEHEIAFIGWEPFLAYCTMLQSFLEVFLPSPSDEALQFVRCKYYIPFTCLNFLRRP